MEMVQERIGYEMLRTGLYLVYIGTVPLGYAVYKHGRGWLAGTMTGEDRGEYRTRTDAAEALRKEREG